MFLPPASLPSSHTGKGIGKGIGTSLPSSSFGKGIGKSAVVPGEVIVDVTGAIGKSAPGAAAMAPGVLVPALNPATATGPSASVQPPLILSGQLDTLHTITDQQCEKEQQLRREQGFCPTKDHVGGAMHGLSAGATFCSSTNTGTAVYGVFPKNVSDQDLLPPLLSGFLTTHQNLIRTECANHCPDKEVPEKCIDEVGGGGGAAAAPRRWPTSGQSMFLPPASLPSSHTGTSLIFEITNQIAPTPLALPPAAI